MIVTVRYLVRTDRSDLRRRVGCSICYRKVWAAVTCERDTSSQVFRFCDRCMEILTVARARGADAITVAAPVERTRRQIGEELARKITDGE